MFNTASRTAVNPQNITPQPIDSLTPFHGNRWWIRVRVTDKSDVRTWSKPTSQGKLFSCTLVDETSAIRATFFNEAVDLFFGMLISGNIFFMSGGSVKPANRRFNNVNNEYEVSFDKDASIVACRDAAVNSSANIPTQRYNFVPISLLTRKENGSLVDMLAVVTTVHDIGSVTQKSTGQQLKKRNVMVADTTAAVELTFWGDEADAFSLPPGTVVAFRNLKVSNGPMYGVNASYGFSSSMDLTPNIQETTKLQQWYANTEGKDVASITGRAAGSGDGTEKRITPRKFFDEIIANPYLLNDDNRFFDVRCIPTYIKTENIWYDACPKCNKKVTPLTGGGPAGGTSYRCEKCDTSTVTPEQRYLCSIQVSDNLTQVWVTLFDNAGVQFFGIPAKEMKMESEKDGLFLSRKAQERLYVPMLCRMRAENQQSRDEAAGGPTDKVRFVCIRLTEIVGAAPNCVRECQDMLEAIQHYHP